MPWSASLPLLAEPMLAYFATLGPGEQTADLYDPGLRQRRSPPSPAKWPSQIGSRAEVGVLDVPAVFTAEIVEPTLPHATPVGTPGVLSYLLELGDFAAFPTS